jgi:tRNA threonylcarbamoyladenosine biosynthesis protein TsaB
MFLAINTSTMQFSLALIDELGEVFGEHLLSSGAKNYNEFMPSLISLFSSQKKAAEDIGAVFVATGPGSYTGLRVGLSIAKGIAYGLHVPIIGVSGLEAMASQLPYADLPVWTMRRGCEG